MNKENDKKICLLSIIIPAFNAKSTLIKCINSLVNQKTDWIEIIIIDDNSKDGSFLIYNKYKKILGPKNFKVINLNKNKGPGYCRNIGIEIASGKFIAFLDSDDFFLENTLKILKKILLNFKPDILINNNLRNKEPFSNNFLFNIFKKKIYKKNEFLRLAIKNKININECWKIIINKEILNKNLIKFPEIYIGEDQCFVFDAIFHSRTIFINKKPIIYHHSSPGGLASSNLKLMTISFVYLLSYFYKKKGKKKLEKNFIREKVRYLEQNFNIVLLNLDEKKMKTLLKKFYDIFQFKNSQFSKNNFIKKTFKNYKTFKIKLLSSMIVKNSKIQKYEIFIFSNNFLGKSIRKFIYNNNEKIKYMFDDNSKFRFVKLENYNFNKNVLNIFYVAITDQQIFKKIKKRIYKLNLNKKLIQFIELF